MYFLALGILFLILEVTSLPTIIPSIEIGTLQSVAAEGQLMCNGKPAKEVKVKLYDEDRGFDLDDLLMEGHTDADGRFYLKGFTYEVSTIDPKVNVYHDCNDESWPCLKKFSIVIPDSYITENSKLPKKTFNVGTINLSGEFSGESRDCINRK